MPMERNFEEALADLISDYVEITDSETMISAMELQIMALKEQSAD